MAQKSKIERATAALRWNEMQWHRALGRAVEALESGENYERMMRIADEFARAARVIQDRIKTLSFETELDTALSAMVAA